MGNLYVRSPVFFLRLGMHSQGLECFLLQSKREDIPGKFNAKIKWHTICTSNMRQMNKESLVTKKGAKFCTSRTPI